MATAGTATGPEETRAWHAMDRKSVLAEQQTSEAGLDAGTASARLEAHGPNRLPRGDPPSVFGIFLRQFRSPLIYVLALAAVVSVVLGHVTDAVFIAIVLLINAAVAGGQEFQAERSARSLQDLIRTTATVLRDGTPTDVDGESVVPGDVVVLESGNRVPADVRLLDSTGLAIDESALTGESVPVGKDPAWVGDDETALGDRENVAFAGTTVTRGRARGVVVDTGTETVVGRLARDVTAVDGGDPPLVVRMERFTRVVGAVVLVAAVLAGIIGVLVQGYGVVEMFLFAVALAVSAIPEGLPVSMTAALGVATRRMATVGVIVRQLVAVEGLGSCTLIATDKTGTLTENELTVRRVRLADDTVYDVTGAGYEPDGTVTRDGVEVLPNEAHRLDRLARATVLCNEALLRRHEEGWTWRGDPTDVALLSFGHKLGWEREDAFSALPEVASIPFEPERRYATTYHEREEGEGAGETLVFVKGAPERVADMCAWSDDDGDSGASSKTEALASAREMARNGFRVLAVAQGVVGDVEDAGPTAGDDVDPSGLEFLGFVGMIDPLRSGVAESIDAAHGAGIDVTMVTGDHPETALAIARELGIAAVREQVTTGDDLAGMTDAAIARAVDETRVFARVSPDQKVQIVQAAQASGHFVAVTGDGVNDAPALRIANIGVAMGKRGTDVARDTAELVLSDDNFSTIVAGIQQGRIAYDNIRKVIYLLVSTGAAELVLIMLALATGSPLPLLPVQILWLNLVTNGIQDVALAFEPEEGDALDRPPRPPDQRIFDRLMVERTVVAAGVMGVVGFLAFQWFLASGWAEADVRNVLLLLMVLFETVHIGNARSETRSILTLSPLSSPILLAGAATAFAIHVASLYFAPLQNVLETAPVSLSVWATLAGLALTLAIALELHKLSWRLRDGRWG